MPEQFNLLIVLSQKKAGNAIASTQNEIRNLDHTVRATSDTWDEHGTSIQGANDRLTNFAQSMKAAVAPLLITAGAALAKFSIDAVASATTFEESMAKVFTLMPDMTADAKDKMTTDVRLMATELKRMPVEIAESMYQAVSLGVPKNNLFEAIRTAAEAARGGSAGLMETLKTGQAIVNAYGGDLYELTDVYDILFTMIKNGALTMDDLNNGFSEVTSVAGESKVPLEDIGGALVTMTRQGDSAQEAFQLLSILLMQLGTDGTAAFKAFEAASGQSFRSFIAEGGSLVEALQMMEEHAESTGKTLGAMIAGDSNFYRDAQAARAAMELTGTRMEMLVTQSKNMEEAYGASATAAKEMAETTQRAFDALKVAGENFKISFGNALKRLFRGLAEDATALLNVANGMYASEIGQQVNELLEAAETTEEIGAHIQTVATQFNNARLLGATDEMEQNWNMSIVKLAQVSQSYDDFVAAVERYVPSRYRVYQADGLHITYMEQSIPMMWVALQQQEYAIRLAQIEAAAQEERAAQYDNIAETIERIEGITPRMNLAMEVTPGRIYEIQRAAREASVPVDNLAKAFENLAQKTGNYFVEALDMEDLQTDIELALLKSAAAAGANIETLEYLAREAGYDEATIDQAVAWALLQKNIQLAGEAADEFELTGEETVALFALLQQGALNSANEIYDWAQPVNEAEAAALGAKLAVDGYNSSLRSVPDEVETEIILTAEDAETRLRNFYQVVTDLDGHTSIVRIHTVYSEEGNPPWAGGYQHPDENTPVNRAHGGIITGQPGTDRIPAMLTRGEGILPVTAMRNIGPELFEQLRRGEIPNILLSTDQNERPINQTTNNVQGDTNIFQVTNDRTAHLVNHLIDESKRQRFNSYMGR